MIRGERFHIDLDKDELELDNPVAPAPSLPFVADVLERTPQAATPPSAPALKNKTGFPEHKKKNTTSRFKQRTAAAAAAAAAAADASQHTGRDVVPPGHGAPSGPAPTPSISEPPSKSWQDQEREQIDRQNRNMLAGMSDAEIEEARQELLGSLDPDLLQSLLRRSHIDSGSNEAENLQPPSEPIEGGILRREKPAKSKSVAFEEDEPRNPSGDTPALLYEQEPDFDDAHAHTHTHTHTHNHPPGHQVDSVHFPTPSQPPSLDPNSATFLEDLHEKYFPDLPSDPSKLDWMKPSSSSSKSAYHPSAAALNPNEIRFAFTGALLPPRTSAAIPVTAGLHHHGDAPDAAGYTIPELAHLSRSSYAAQRCIAFQTLGRILYRLGQGEFGDPGQPGQNLVGAEETLGELARGLWREVEKEKVVEQLVAESEGKGVDGGRHVSARAYATEAVWLWQKGGGRRWKAD